MLDVYYGCGLLKVDRLRTGISAFDVPAETGDGISLRKLCLTDVLSMDSQLSFPGKLLENVKSKRREGGGDNRLFRT